MDEIKKGIDRREFLKKAGGIVAAGISIPLISGTASAQEAPKDASKDKLPGYSTQEKKDTDIKVIKRPLGKTGMEVSIVSMGVMNCSDPSVVMRAYEMGINFFDTAASYQGGNNEKMLGDIFEKNKIRDKVFIQTKVGAKDIPWMQSTFEKSLASLKTDHVDVLLVHALSSVDDIKNQERIAFLQKQKKEGKARFIGFSTHSNMEELILAAAGMKVYDVILSTYNCKSPDSLKAAIKKAKEAGIGIVAMKTQLERRRKRDEAKTQSEPADHPTMLKVVVADENIGCAVPGVTTIPQIESLAAVGKEKPVMQKSELELLKNIQASLDGERCVLCGKCSGKCKYGMNAHDAIRAALYLEHYGDYSLAKETINSFKKDISSLKCTSCSECSIKCFNNINVKDKVIDIYNMLA